MATARAIGAAGSGRGLPLEESGRRQAVLMSESISLDAMTEFFQKLDTFLDNALFGEHQS
jgi:hypothetical protein